MSTKGRSDSDDLLSKGGGGTTVSLKSTEKQQTVAERIASTPGARGQSGARPKDGFFEARNAGFEDELWKMKAEWDELEQEEADSSKSRQLESMRRELEAKRKKVKSLRGKTLSELKCSVRSKKTSSTKSSVGYESDQSGSSDSKVDINKLRKDNGLKAKAKRS